MAEPADSLAELRLGAPSAYISDVHGLWPELRARVFELVGVTISDAWLEPTEDSFEVWRKGTRLLHEPWSDDWLEPAALAIAALSSQLFTLEQARLALDEALRGSKALTQAVEKSELDLLLVYEVLVSLLRERISIADMDLIVTTLLVNLRFSKDVGLLTERVRTRLAAWLCQRYEREPGVLDAVSLSDEVSKALLDGAQLHQEGGFLVIDPALGKEIVSRVQHIFESFGRMTTPMVLLAHPQVRQALAKLCERSLPDVPVLSWNEIAAGVKVMGQGTVTWQTQQSKG